jgi:hypothetical protein
LEKEVAGAFDATSVALSRPNHRREALSQRHTQDNLRKTIAQNKKAS